MSTGSFTTDNRSASEVTAQSPLLDQYEAGAYIRVHGNTLANWRLEGRGPLYVRVGRRAFYRRADLDAWLDAHAHQSTKDEALLQTA